MKDKYFVPKDISDVIDRVYKKGDYKFVASRLVRDDKWNNLFKDVFRGFVIVDETDFNYGRSHELHIWLTNDKRAGVHRSDIQQQLLTDVGSLYSVCLFVSIFCPYYMIRFHSCYLTENDVSHVFEWDALSVKQSDVVSIIETEMASRGYRRLDKLLALHPVPDVETELKDKGTVTVADCLMGG